MRFSFLICICLIVAPNIFSSCKNEEKKPAPTIDVLLEGEWVKSSRLLINGEWQEDSSTPNEWRDVLSYRFTSATQGTKTLVCGKYIRGFPIGTLYGCKDTLGNPLPCEPKQCESGSTAFSWTFDTGNQVVELTASTGEKITWKIVEIKEDMIRANQILGRIEIPMPGGFPLGNIDGIESILKRKK